MRQREEIPQEDNRSLDTRCVSCNAYLYHRSGGIETEPGSGLFECNHCLRMRRDEFEGTGPEEIE